MVNWMNTWLEGIIIAVIIGTIIELLLPKSSISKYIKVVIGIYILFTIITPVINKFSDKQININNIITTDSIAIQNPQITDNVTNTNNQVVLDVYEENIKLDLKNKLQIKGYVTDYIIINISNDGKYNIEKIEVKIKEKTTQKQEEKQATTIIDNIENVKINISNSSEKSESTITESEKNTLINYISTAYELNSSKIIVN